MKKKRLLSAFTAYYRGPKSDHFDGKRFFNPWNPKLPKTSQLIRWKLLSRAKFWPKRIKKILTDIPPRHVMGNRLRSSFVGHSTMFIQTQGINILTDPIWSRRASPFNWFGPKRSYPPGIPFDYLPKIDLILISHNHYDHLDINTISRIWSRDRCKIIAPLGNDAVIHSKHKTIQVEILDWYESLVFNENVNIHLEPAQHWSARGVWDKNKALWGAFVIETKGGNIFFSGDTGYGNGHIFKDAKKRFGKFRFAMLPIGAYEPQWFMSYAHMSPQEAVKAYKDLGQPYTAAIHFQTFRLGDEGQEDPKNYLSQTLKKWDLDENKFRALNIGEAWMIPET